MRQLDSASHCDGHRVDETGGRTVRSEICPRSGRIGFRAGVRRYGHSGRVGQRGHGLMANLWRFYV